MKLYQKISNLMYQRENSGDYTWTSDEAEKIENIIKNHFPHGGGFDGQTWIDLDKSKTEKLVFFTEYHHLTENGYYDGWSTLKIVVKPSLRYGFDFKLTGIKRKYRFDRDYFEDVINELLNCEVK